MPTPFEIGYLVALYEGEGSVVWDKRKKTGSRARVQITMTDVEPLQKFLSFLGKGRLTGPHSPPTTTRKPTYRFRLCGWHNVKYFYELVKDHLSPRRRQRFDEAAHHYMDPVLKPCSPICDLSDPNIPSRTGYDRHRKKGEYACINCKKARSLYELKYKKDRSRPGAKKYQKHQPIEGYSEIDFMI
jgi:hypothetical protein